MAMDVDMEAGAAMAATMAATPMVATPMVATSAATPMVGTMAEATIRMCMVTTAGTECCKRAARSV